MSENTLDLTQEEEIERYVASSYTTEYAIELNNAIALLELFQYPELKDKLTQLIYSAPAEDPDYLHVSFNNEVVEMALSTVNQHGIALAEEVSLGQISQVLVALYTLPRREDSAGFLGLLEVNDISNEEKFAKLLCHVTSLTEEDAMTILIEVQDVFLKRLYTLLSRDNVTEEEALIDPAIVDNFRHFVKFMNDKGDGMLGLLILETGMLVGLPFRLYMAYFADEVNSTHAETIAIDLMSVLLISSDAWESPIAVYREMSESLVKDTVLRSSVETHLKRILEDFQQYKEAMNHDT